MEKEGKKSGPDVDIKTKRAKGQRKEKREERKSVDE